MRLVHGLIFGAALLLIVLVFTPATRPALEAAAQAPAADQAMTPMPAGDAEHGKYIVEHVAMCIECHSGRDARGNIVPDQLFMGNWLPVQAPWPDANWALRAPRIAGLPGYTDDQGVRLLTKGAINRLGFQLRSPMPKFRMSREDALDVVRYLKSLPTTF
ncbi:MAG: cytochrome c [Vicinamibacterales bacterium]